MSEVCSELVTIPRRDRAKAGLRFYAGVARHLIDPVPYAVAQYRSRAYRRAVRSALARTRYDRIVCDFLVPAINLPRRLPSPALLFTHNVEAEIWRRHAETETSRLRRRLYRQQWARMRRFEGRTLARFDRILAVSDVDRDTLQRSYPDSLTAPVSVIPTGVDTDVLRSQPRRSIERRRAFLHRVDGLAAERRRRGVLLPRDSAAHPRRQNRTSHSRSSGRSPTPAVRRLAAEPGVEVTGRVDDVRPYLATSTVNVVPLRIGGGTRLKIFEAMAAGRAVVSTSIGAEGLPTENGRHLLLADDPTAFARSVVTLLRDAETRRRRWSPRRARSSPSATTGPRLPPTSTTLSPKRGRPQRMRSRPFP